MVVLWVLVAKIGMLSLIAFNSFVLFINASSRLRSVFVVELISWQIPLEICQRVCGWPLIVAQVIHIHSVLQILRWRWCNSRFNAGPHMHTTCHGGWLILILLLLFYCRECFFFQMCTNSCIVWFLCCSLVFFNWFIIDKRFTRFDIFCGTLIGDFELIHVTIVFCSK